LKLCTKLTNRELRILSLLAQGQTYNQVKERLAITTIENVHVTCYNIRKKTGIRQTRDPNECRAYMEKVAPDTVRRAFHLSALPAEDGLTEGQAHVLRLIAAGRTYKQIATFFGTTSQSVQNLACRACKRAGIRSAGWNRTHYIREWVKTYYGEETIEEPHPDLSGALMGDPMF